MTPSLWRSKVVYLPQKCPKFPGTPFDTISELAGLKIHSITDVAQLFHKTVRLKLFLYSAQYAGPNSQRTFHSRGTFL